MNLVQLESRIAFQRALIVYGYCSMMKRSLPRELVAEASIVLLQTLLKRIDVTDNYDVVKMYFTEMVDFSCLDNVIFKDYYLTIIKGYIAKLISAICMRKNDELYETYELIYQETLDNGCVNRTFETIYPIVQESYAIGYFNHSYLYVNIDYDYYLRTVINYYYSSNVLPLQNDIDKCLLAVDYSDYNDEQDIKNMLYRTYKKTLFLNNYYDGYKKNVFLVISKILEKLNSIETDVLDEISNVLENLFINVIEDYYLVFEGGSDEFISSAVMDNLEYFAYLVYQLYLFNMADSNKKILKTILLCLNNSLQEHNPYINMVINTLLYSFTDSTEEVDAEYIKEFEKSYEIRDKNDSLYLNYKRLVNACILYISGSISFEEFGDYLYRVYNDKIHIDRKINY